MPPLYSEPEPELGPEAEPDGLDEASGAAEPAVSPDDAVTRGELHQALQRGEVGRAAGLAGEADFAALVQSIGEGEAVLRSLGLVSEADPPATKLEGVMLAPGKASRQLLMVFGDESGGYAIPRAVIEGRRPNLLFLRDPKRALGLLGVARLGGSYDDCLVAILRLARQLDVAEIFCLGADDAAYSALRFGLDLGAAGVLAMGSLVRLDDGWMTSERRRARQTAKLLKVAAVLGADLEDAYARAAPRPGLVLCRSDPAAFAGLAALPGAVVTEAGVGSGLLHRTDEAGVLSGLVGQLLLRNATE